VFADKVEPMASVSALNWTFLSNAAALKVGDLVSADAGGMPIYRVVALADGKAWLNDEEHAAQQVMPVDRFRWKAALSR
jgi:hypothetical protein